MSCFVFSPPSGVVWSRGHITSFELIVQEYRKGKIMTTAKRGRPAKNPPEKMFFGIKCTPAERKKVVQQINRAGIRDGVRVTHSDFFLRACGVRK